MFVGLSGHPQQLSFWCWWKTNEYIWCMTIFSLDLTPRSDHLEKGLTDNAGVPYCNMWDVSLPKMHVTGLIIPLLIEQQSYGIVSEFICSITCSRCRYIHFTYRLLHLAKQIYVDLSTKVLIICIHKYTDSVIYLANTCCSISAWRTPSPMAGQASFIICNRYF